MKRSGLVIVTGSAEETAAVGERLGAALRPGDVAGLCGELGSGKTVLAQGLARGLGAAPGVLVTSPSFVILREYPGRLPLYHFDFYRLAREEDVRALGYEEYFEGDGVAAVEWADKFPALFGPATLWARFTTIDERSRRILFEPGEGLLLRWPELERALRGEI